jgi:hypothetical protein
MDWLGFGILWFINRRSSIRSLCLKTMSKGISIDNHKLHDIEMPIAKIDGKYPACIRYPKSRIEHQRDGDILFFLIPPLLCIELFRSGILTSKNELARAVSFKISGKSR